MPTRITRPTPPPFRHSIALVVGINSYSGGIPPLQSAVPDATRLAALLEEHHGFQVLLRRDGEASGAALRTLLRSELPALLGPDDRLLLYFAGHGLAADEPDGPQGYLLPADANTSDRGSFLPMLELQQALDALPCRHLLLILDCCFAGAFRWSSTRSVVAQPPTLYWERFERYLHDPAWQVIASAADDQQAADLLGTFGSRDDDGQHSPFARALFAGLAGGADLAPANGQGDGAITATELYCYVRDQVEQTTTAHARRQTPAMWPLARHGKGEFLFWDPRRPLSLATAPTLDEQNNPYRGLQPFEPAQRDLFFGRSRVARQLREAVARQPLTTVVGPSGSGKSSLVQAGLLPALAADPCWQIGPTLRPGTHPAQLLKGALGLQSGQLAPWMHSWAAAHPGQRMLLVVDQCEELLTLCRDVAEREAFLSLIAEALLACPESLRVVLTVRSDFEPQLALDTPLATGWAAGRFVVPPLTQDELREVIVGPATARVLTFESEAMIERMINEVVQMPGALPLLSFALSEIYERYLQRQRRGAVDRTLRMEDYERVGGVAGALRHRADAEYLALDAAGQATMQQVMLRMVALGAGELTRRRAPRDELAYPQAAENARVATVLGRLEAARLVVSGSDTAGLPYVEPAHDALIGGWNRLWGWAQQSQERLVLQRRLGDAAREWQAGGQRRELLWNDDPRLRQAELLPARQPGLLRLFYDDLTNCTPRPAPWLNSMEQAFVIASGHRRQRVRQRGAALLLATLAIFATLTAIAWGFAAQAAAARDEAYRQRDLANARGLALEALVRLIQGDDGELSGLLARQAYLFGQRAGTLPPEAEQALAAALEQPKFAALTWPPGATGMAEAVCQGVRRNLTGAEWQRVLPGQPYEATCPALPAG